MTFQTLKDGLALCARAFLRDRRGSVIVMIPVFFLVAAGFASLAVDMGHLYSLRIPSNGRCRPGVGPL